MIKILKAPYPTENSNSSNWKKSFLMSSFVFLFLYFFQPFGLNSYPFGVLQLTLGYGLTCLITMSFLNILLPSIFQNYFLENNWNVGKQIFWSIVNVACIGLANLLYSNFMEVANLSFGNLLLFEGYTVALAFFPLLLFIFTNQKLLRNRFEKAATAINNKLKTTQTEESEQSPQQIILESENNTDSLIVSPDELIYIQSADNYIAVYYLKENKFSSILLRNTLKSIDSQLSSFSQFFRCHKSYLVNLNKVICISGNAQGFKLHLENTDERVPVSRSHNTIIKELLTIRP
ncbi:LytTR family transcriptional regulator [bacterium]|nr:LytTR family transcriptional regulator [bacterium]